MTTDAKRESAQCDELAATMGYRVIKLEQRRASKIHLGTPDRRFQGGRCCFWFEYKFGRDKLSREQHTFLRAELDGGALASCGGLAELIALLSAISRSNVAARDCCERQIASYVEKGFRGERRAA